MFREAKRRSHFAVAFSPKQARVVTVAGIALAAALDDSYLFQMSQLINLFGRPHHDRDWSATKRGEISSLGTVQLAFADQIYRPSLSNRQSSVVVRCKA